MESSGKLSLEGCVELAWIMGLIKFHNGPLKGQNLPYIGWVDAKSQLPVTDDEVKLKYEAEIIKHTGIRFIEPALFGGYDPNKKTLYQEIAIVDDMPPLEVSQEEAQAFKLRHGEHVVVEHRQDQWFIHIKKGATIIVTKALQFDRLVAGQIPTGWNAATFGVPDDIIKQVDPVTLYVLVSTVEAVVQSGYVYFLYSFYLFEIRMSFYPSTIKLM